MLFVPRDPAVLVLSRDVMRQAERGVLHINLISGLRVRVLGFYGLGFRA